MTQRLMSLATLQIACLVGLVRGVEVVRLPGPGRPSWGVLIHGRGFDRLLQDDILIAPTLIRPMSAYLPRPRAFFTATHAEQFVARAGLKRLSTPTPTPTARAR